MTPHVHDLLNNIYQWHVRTVACTDQRRPLATQSS